MNDHPRVYYMSGVSPRLWKNLRRNLNYISEMALWEINLPAREYPKEGENVDKALESMIEQDKESLADLESIRRKFYNRKVGKYFSPTGCNYGYTFKYCKRKKIVAIFIKKDGIESRLRNRKMLDSKLDLEFADGFLRAMYQFREEIKWKRIMNGEFRVKNADVADYIKRIFGEIEE